jgi:hypothetical protein
VKATSMMCVSPVKAQITGSVDPLLLAVVGQYLGNVS